jgi:DNA-binding beta-propeller fold protein YncE
MRSFLLSAIVLFSSGPARSQEKLAIVVDGDPLLTTPFGFDFLPDGSLIVADFGGNRICKIDRDNHVSVVAGDGEAGHRDGPPDRARFNQPHNVVVAADGTLLVADTSNHCVRLIDLSRGKVSTAAGKPESGFAGDGGPARDAVFNQAYHVVATDHGFLLVDLGNRRIRAVEQGMIRTVAGNGAKGVPNDGALAGAAPLVDPRAVARDRQGNVWILERSGNALRVVDKAGRIRTVAGTGKVGPASDGPALECTLNGPKFVFCEDSGDVLIADTDNHCIRRYSALAHTLTTIAGTGEAGEGAAGGEPTTTALNQPHGVAVAPDGAIYIADSLNGRILKIE